MTYTEGPWHLHNPGNPAVIFGDQRTRWTYCNQPVGVDMQLRTMCEPGNMFPGGWYHREHRRSLSYGFCTVCQDVATMLMLVETEL